MKLAYAWKLRLARRELTLVSLAALAVGLAWVLSSPGSGAWAAYQSPISPPSPSSPLAPQPTPIVSPTAVVAGALSPASASQTAGGGSGTAMLVAGGIVLAGLIVGAVVLLVRGQPPDEPQKKE